MTNDKEKYLSGRIRFLMRQYRLTQQGFADKVGINLATAHSLLHSINSPTYRSLGKIKLAFPEITWDWLLGQEEIVTELSVATIIDGFPYHSSFGERLAILKEREGLKNKDLSSLTGIDLNSISILLNNKREPSLKTLAKLKQAFPQYPWAFFLDGELYGPPAKPAKSQVVAKPEPKQIVSRSEQVQAITPDFKGDLTTIAGRLQYILHYFKLSQRKMAAKMGVSVSSLSKQIMAGASPSFDTMTAIVNAFDIAPAWLLTGHGPMFQSQQDVTSATAQPQQVTSSLDDSEREILLSRIEELENALRSQIEVSRALLPGKDLSGRTILPQPNRLPQQPSQQPAGNGRQSVKFERNRKAGMQPITVLFSGLGHNLFGHGMSLAA